jgi:integrase
MPRRRLELGQHGPIHTKPVKEPGRPRYVRAYCSYRGYDGRTTQIERRGGNSTDARQALQDVLEDLRHEQAENLLKPTSTFREASQIWLAEYADTRRASTLPTVKTRLNTWILPALGDLRLIECTIRRIDDFISGLTKKTTRTGQPMAPNYRRAIRSAVSEVMQVAVRHGAVDTNPVRDIRDIEGGARRKPRALNEEEAGYLLELLDRDEKASKAELGAIIRGQIYTATRIGEILALRWCDTNLTDTPRKIVMLDGSRAVLPPGHAHINGGMTYIPGEGLVRSQLKTTFSEAIIPLPEAFQLMLMLRRPSVCAETDPVYPSQSGTFRWPNNVRTQLRAALNRFKAANAVDDEVTEAFFEFVNNLDGISTHIGRKTAGTALHEAGQSDRSVADALRKGSIADVKKSYLGRGMSNPESAKILDQFLRPKTQD